MATQEIYGVGFEFDPLIPKILPHLKVYSIQIGYKLFRISGASLSSDAPSYFTNYFLTKGNEDKTLFVDRSPTVFEYIYQHLQGYHVEVPNSEIYTQLWLDSYYFQVKRLRNILRDEGIFVNVGGENFKVPQQLLMETGNHPNYFSVSLDSLGTDQFRLVERLKVIRPPPQKTISVPHRSPRLFSDLMEVLRGNTTVLGDKNHRRLLIRECRYYRLQELEQRIVNCRISANSHFENKQDILIDIVDVSPKGIIYNNDTAGKESHVQYTRPFIKKEKKSNLILQFNSDYCEVTRKLNCSPKLVLNRKLGLAFVRLSGNHCLKLMNLLDITDIPVENTEDGPSVMIFAGLANANTTINGLEVLKTWAQDLIGVPLRTDGEIPAPDSKRQKLAHGVNGDVIELSLVKSSWRVFLTNKVFRFHGVAIEAVTDELSFYKTTFEFL